VWETAVCVGSVLFVSMLFAAHYKFCLQFVCILRLLES